MVTQPQQRYAQPAPQQQQYAQPAPQQQQQYYQPQQPVAVVTQPVYNTNAQPVAVRPGQFVDYSNTVSSLLSLSLSRLKSCVFSLSMCSFVNIARIFWTSSELEWSTRSSKH